MKLKLFASVCVAAGLCLGLAGCGEDKATSQGEGSAVTLTVGASPVPHSDILAQVAPVLQKDGISLKVIEFSDYVKPNLSLADKEIDANFFQHLPYLESFAKDRGLKLTSLVAVHIEPMGGYSSKIKTISEVPSEGKVAIPNDPTNGGRALKVLETAGLIKLKDGVGVTATVADVVENPKNLKFIEVEAAQLPRALDDVALAVINSNYALGANLNPTKDAIAIESKDSPYANVIAIREGEATRPELQKLKEALTSEAVRKYLEKTYKGAVVPAF